MHEALFGPARRWLPAGRDLSEADWSRRHRVIVAVAAVHIPLLWLYGVLRGEGWDHSLAEAMVALGAVGVAGSRRLSRRVRTLAATFALATSSAILVHLSDGLIEAHFHFFIVITVVLLYQDWVVFVLTFAYVFVHHTVLGLVAPEAVFNHEAALEAPLLWAGIHGASIVAVSVAGLVAWRFNERERARVDAYAVELREALGAKNRLLAAVSHDLRSPLVVIEGYGSALARADDTMSVAQVREYAAAIRSSGAQLSELVNDILTAAALHGGGIPPSPRPVRLQELVSESLSALDSTVDGVRLDTAGVQVFADAVHVRRIVTNLVTNAMKYGQPPIEVLARRRGELVELRVRDRGGGVPAAFVPRLFEPFTQADGGGGPTAGVGLGLSLVRDLARANGGDVRYEREGDATAFVVTLPAVDAPSDQPAANAIDARVRSPSPS